VLFFKMKEYNNSRMTRQGSGNLVKRRITGLCIFCIGLGMILVIVVPALGWIFMTALILIGLGCGLFRC